MTAATLRRSQVNSSRFGRYTRYEGRVQGWKVTAENTGPAGSPYGVYVTSPCGRGFENVGNVAGGRGVADRIAELAAREVPRLVHNAESCDTCTPTGSPFVLLHTSVGVPKDDGGPRSRWFVKDRDTDARLVEGLFTHQDAERWLRDHLAGSVASAGV